MGKIYDLGIDVGSTTVKTVILDEGEFIYNKYERHFSKVRETVAEQLRTIRELYPDDKFKIAITGSAGLGIAEASGISFVQEVFSAFIAVNKKYPKADVVVELGGEDAKIIFLTGGVEQRMNGFPLPSFLLISLVASPKAGNILLSSDDLPTPVFPVNADSLPSSTALTASLPSPVVLST